MSGRSGIAAAVLFMLAAGLALLATLIGTSMPPEVLGLSVGGLIYVVAGIAFLAGVVALAYRRLPR